MSSVGQHNPEWLYIASFNDTFDWTKGIKTTFSTFFEHVTLHDSYWHTINLNVTNETILSIKLDAFWNKEYTLKFENSDNWPFLIIKIPNVLNISYSTVDYQTIIASTSCLLIEMEEIKKHNVILSESNLFSKGLLDRLVGCKEVNKTTFNDIYGGSIEILHDSEIEILLIEENGTYIDPCLNKVVPFDKRVDMNKSEDKGFFSKLWDKLKW